jgi:hypothetical protein
MVTMLEKYTTEGHRSVVHFLWEKELNAMNIHKDMFPVYGGMCLSRKAVHKRVEKRGGKTPTLLGPLETDNLRHLRDPTE